jgi:Protein of unknown function (DUF4446)
MTESVAIIVTGVLVVVLVIWQTIQVQAMRKKVDGVPTDGNTVAMLRALDDRTGRNSAQVAQLTKQVGDISTRLPSALNRFAVVEFDAFGNITGNQSRSICILNDVGDGLVITLLTARDETIFYTKEVRGGRGVQELAPEERASVDRALGR